MPEKQDPVRDHRWYDPSLPKPPKGWRWVDSLVGFSHDGESAADRVARAHASAERV